MQTNQIKFESIYQNTSCSNCKTGIWKIRRSRKIACTETERMSEATSRATQQIHIDCIYPLWLKTERC